MKQPHSGLHHIVTIVSEEKQTNATVTNYNEYALNLLYAHTLDKAPSLPPPPNKFLHTFVNDAIFYAIDSIYIRCHRIVTLLRYLHYYVLSLLAYLSNYHCDSPGIAVRHLDRGYSSERCPIFEIGNI